MKKSQLLSLVLGGCLLAAQAKAGWTPLTHQPTFNVSTSFLLMDGRVLVNEVDNSGFSTVRWWTLSPDPQGSYLNGTWTQVGNAVWTHLYFGSGVFPDGRVIICGGEYSNAGNWTNKTEIFNPLTNTWTEIPGPPGWSQVGDAPAVILQDGRFYIGNIFDKRTAFYDSTTGLWTAGPQFLNTRSAEETWIVLPDNSVLKWDCFGHPGTERWLPTTNTWISCGNTPVDLVLPQTFETGAGILLPNGKTFCIGGPPATCLYTMPPNINNPGTWTNGPVPPQVGGKPMGAEDAPAVILPNGNVLMALAWVDVTGQFIFNTPTYYFEYDGNTIVQVATAPNNSGPPYVGHFLNLPTGEILESVGESTCYLYTNGGGPQAAWKPHITAVSNVLEKGFNYTTTGTQYNGVTNGNSYGDECYTATNYPIVRITNPGNGNVFYLRSFNPSTMGVQTGNTPVTANFAVGNNVAAGNYQMQVIASGMASDTVNVTVPNSFLASSFSIFRGKLVSGGVPEIQTSNDQYLNVARGVVANQAESPIQVIFHATSTNMNPTFLGLSIEDAINAAGMSRKIQFLNVQTNQYEDVDTRTLGTTDQTVIVNAAGTLSRFVNQGTGDVTVKVQYFQTGVTNTLAWVARFDRVAVLGL